MRCPCCDKDQWRNIDNFRFVKNDLVNASINSKIELKCRDCGNQNPLGPFCKTCEKGMHMCESCGFVTYPYKIKSEEEIKEYYRKEYRPAPVASNLFTGERKLQYHAFFLQPLFDEWKKAGIDKPVVGEIGSAMGMFLNWFKQVWPDSDIHGTELTESFRRVAYHEYGINLVEDFNTNKKYDMIASYHVLEHQADPDKKLAEYAACLKDHGVFYLSCPIWFRDAANGAAGGFDIEYYWHPDHINCWSEEHLEHIIKKAGLAIVAKNTEMYGNTYLLKKADVKADAPNFDFNKYLEVAKNIYDCWALIQEQKTAEAIAAHRNCYAAWVNHYEFNRAKLYKDKESFDKLFQEATSACPNSADMLIFTGEVYARHERYTEALSFFEKALMRKPNNPSTLMGMANCYRMMAKREKDPVKQVELYGKAVNVNRFVMATSTEMMPQALSWVYQDSAQIPVPL